jgi:predicted dinucleotide-binding enzyme
MATEHKIAILGGTGAQGSGLALRMAKAGHAVTIGSRDAAKARTAAAEASARAGKPIAGADNRGAASSPSPTRSSAPRSRMCSPSSRARS